MTFKQFEKQKNALQQRMDRAQRDLENATTAQDKTRAVYAKDAIRAEYRELVEEYHNQ